MKLIRTVSLASAMLASGTLAWAAPVDQHAGRHPTASEPAAAATTDPASASPSVADDAGADMARTDAQIEAMRDMHNMMMAAKTPEGGQVLMAEHVAVMRDGMGMMDRWLPKACPAWP